VLISTQALKTKEKIQISDGNAPIHPDWCALPDVAIASVEFLEENVNPELHRAEKMARDSNGTEHGRTMLILFWEFLTTICMIE
jgi:hypothetical protein